MRISSQSWLSPPPPGSLVKKKLGCVERTNP